MVKSSGVKNALSFAVVLAICAAAMAAIYSDFIFKPLPRDLLGMGDHWLQNGPYAYYSDWALQRGELPLWNSLTECGKPHAANPQVALFYPPNFLRSKLTFKPTPFKTFVGLALMIAAHILLAAVATYYFARSHGLSRGASWVVTFAFVFSANFLLRATLHWPFVAILAWLPALLLITHRMVNAPTFARKLTYALSAGVVLGFTLLVGFPQLDLYLAVSMCGYAALYLALYRPWRGASQTPGAMRVVGRELAALAVVFAVGVPVGMATWYPSAELAQYTARVKESALSFEFDARMQHSLREVAHCLISYAGAPQPENLRFIGAGAFLLACAGLLFARNRNTILFGILFLALMDCSLGTPLPMASLMQALAPFRMFTPERACLFACLPLAMLAGLGADAIGPLVKSKPFRWVCGALLLAIGAVVCWRAYAWVTPDRRVHITPVLAALGPALAVAIAALGLTVARARALPWLFAAAVLAENLLWGRPYERAAMDLYPYYPTTKPMWERTPEEMAQEWPRSEPLEQRFFLEHTMPLDNVRATSVQWNSRTFDLAPAMNGYETLFLYDARQVLCSSWAASRYTREINQFEVTRDSQRGNLLFKRHFWLARQFVTEPLPDRETVFPPTTTAFLRDAPDDLPLPRLDSEEIPRRSVSSETTEVAIRTPEELQHEHTITRPGQEITAKLMPLSFSGSHSALFIEYRSESGGWVESTLDDAYTGRRELGKKAWFSPTKDLVGLIEIPVPDYEMLLTTLTFHVNDAPATLKVERIYALRDRLDENNLIHIERRTANQVELTVGNLPDNRILSFLDADYPGWSAYVDWKEVPIYRAADAFKGIVVPPGTHTVRFDFKAPAVTIGFVVSLLTSIAAGLAATLMWLRDHYPEPVTASGNTP